MKPATHAATARRFVVAPDLFSINPTGAAAVNFTRYLAESRPDGVVLVVATGTDPVAATAAVEPLRAAYRGPITLLYSGMMRARLHRHGGWPAHNPIQLASGPHPLADTWRIVALNPHGDSRYAGSQAIRLARLLETNIICAGGASASLVTVRCERAGQQECIWAVELGRLPSSGTRGQTETAAFVVIESTSRDRKPHLAPIARDGSITVDGVTYPGGRGPARTTGLAA